MREAVGFSHATLDRLAVRLTLVISVAAMMILMMVMMIMIMLMMMMKLCLHGNFWSVTSDLLRLDDFHLGGALMTMTLNCLSFVMSRNDHECLARSRDTEIKMMMMMMLEIFAMPCSMRIYSK